MNMKSNLTRRQFSKLTAATIAATAPAMNVLGANEKIQLGFIGQGGRGTHHFRQFKQYEDIHIVSLCDPYIPNYERNASQLEHAVQTTQDFRHVLDNKDVDAVIVSSPDHWHAHHAIYACQAGKDVYVEKPMSRTIEEGQRLVEVVEKTNRIVQVGQQQRSSEQFQKAVDMVKNGEIGKVTSARCLNMWPIDGYLSPQGKHGIGVYEDSPPPEGLDYDMWLGPVPRRPFNKNHFIVNFYFYLDYSGGMLTAWGVHLFDIVLWAMGPQINGAACFGGQFAHDDDRDTPDTCEAVWDTPGYTFHYSMRHGSGFPDDPDEGQQDHGIFFYGDKATILVNRTHLKVFPEKDFKNPIVIPAKGGDHEHKRNFLDSIRSRTQPCCPVRQGYEANLAGQLALISWQVGRSIQWDSKKETIIGDGDARKLMSREYSKDWKLPKA
jgi:predicted dehydrogenase